MTSLSFNMIMPMGSDIDFPQKKEIISKISNLLYCNVYFPLYNFKKPNFNLEESIIHVEKAKFIIADLSSERPSCYYELGIAEVLKKKVYLIAKNDTEIHQTSHRSEVVFYTDLNEFTSLITNILKKELK